jgi:hypothetical protein
MRVSGGKMISRQQHDAARLDRIRRVGGRGGQPGLSVKARLGSMHPPSHKLRLVMMKSGKSL